MFVLFLVARVGVGSRERERPREMWETYINWFLPTCILTGDRTHNLGTCSDQESNKQPFSVQNDHNWATPARTDHCIFNNYSFNLRHTFIVSQLIIKSHYFVMLSDLFISLLIWLFLFRYVARPWKELFVLILSSTHLFNYNISPMVSSETTLLNPKHIFHSRSAWLLTSYQYFECTDHSPLLEGFSYLVSESLHLTLQLLSPHAHINPSSSPVCIVGVSL